MKFRLDYVTNSSSSSYTVFLGVEVNGKKEQFASAGDDWSECFSNAIEDVMQFDNIKELSTFLYSSKLVKKDLMNEIYYQR